MTTNGFITLRGNNALHMVDKKIIEEVEVGAKRTRIVTPYHIIEVETRYNIEVLSSLCERAVEEVVASQKADSGLYPRLTDLPF